MTFEELAKQAETLVDERVKAESPSITDTPRRRFAVFQGELTVLLAKNNLPVDIDAVRAAGEKYAFGPKESDEPTPDPIQVAPRGREKPQKAPETEA